MINLESIRTKIVTGLTQYLGNPVILLGQNKPKPDYPYLTYKFTTPYKSPDGRPIELFNIVPSNDPSFDFDIEETKIEQPTITLSLTAYSLDSMQAHELALMARGWFECYGYQILKDSNLIVVSVEAMGNRDTLIVDDYEQRVGFDVILRTVSTISRRIETIEEYSLNKTE